MLSQSFLWLVRLAFDIFYLNAPDFKENNAAPSLVGLVVAGESSSPNLAIPRVRNRCKFTVIALVPSSRKLIMGVHLLNLALSTNPLLLCNDVYTNPGPFDHCVNLSSPNSSFSPVSEESFMSTSSNSDTDNENCSSTYFNLGLGDDGLRIGHWNVNFLTGAKFDQTKLFLLVNCSSGRPQIEILLLCETFLKPSVLMILPLQHLLTLIIYLNLISH